MHSENRVSAASQSPQLLIINHKLIVIYSFIMRITLLYPDVLYGWLYRIQQDNLQLPVH